MRRHVAKILFNQPMGGAYRHMAMTCPDHYERAVPGQFVMLSIPGRQEPLLRRPFSIHRLLPGAEGRMELQILYKVVGTATRSMAALSAGDALDILGPLGRGFSIPDSFDNVLIVAGGVGVAPMVFLADILKERKKDLTRSAAHIGGKSVEDVLCAETFEDLGMSVCRMTDDGTCGAMGLVTDGLDPCIVNDAPDAIFACGPTPMLKCVAEMAAARNAPCQVSVETMMACGVGACLGCAVEDARNPDHYLHACRDGPVFDIRALRL